MVGVGMGQQQHVQTPIPEGHDGAQFAEERLRTRPAVDQHLAPRGRLDQDAVTLANVQKVNVQQAIGLTESRNPDDERSGAQAGQGGGRKDAALPVPGSPTLDDP